MTYAIKVRPAGATAWFWLHAGGWPSFDSRRGVYPKLTTRRERAAVYQYHAEDVAREINALPGYEARTVEIIKGNGRSL